MSLLPMIAPSLRSADFSRLGAEANAVRGADRLPVDVDCFVPGSAIYGAQDTAGALEGLRSQAGAASPHRHL